MPAIRMTCIAATTAVAIFPTLAAADDGHGPDHYRVTALKPGAALVLHRENGPKSAILAYLPHDARKLKNLGCKGGMSFAAWSKATKAERERAKDRRWCKVSFRRSDGKTLTGWVNGRYLRED